VPAAVGCIPYLEHARGAWYVRGGLARLRDALALLLAEVGVEVHTGTAVSRVLTDGSRSTGVLICGQRMAADTVDPGTATRRCCWTSWRQAGHP